MDSGLDWQQVLLWSTALSLVAVVATIVAVPWLVARLPHDYFCRPQRFVWRKSSQEPLLARALTVVKNLLGALLVLLGLLMLVTPGQGLLTLLAGLLLMNFPGKYRLERWLVLRPGILRGLNWLRRRYQQAPLVSPPPWGDASSYTSVAIQLGNKVTFQGSGRDKKTSRGKNEPTDG